MNEALLLKITCPSLAEAKSIAELLIEKHLAAGVNILPNIMSIYHWQGQIHNKTECLLEAQIVADNFEAICDLVTKQHSYQLPCIVALPIIKTNAGLLQWIRENSRS